MRNFIKTETLLRIGLAFAFLYPAASALFNPFSWIGYFPDFILTAVGSYDMLLLHTFGLFEVCIAVWLVLGKNIFIPALVASVLLLLIIILNITQMDVLFRDIPILLMAVVLTLKHKIT